MSDDRSRPLENPDVEVTAFPADGKNPAHTERADRVEKGLRERVERSLEENKGDGAPA
ncbi:MAG: hypothetical protein U9Q03_06310 [Patescibacteria group bacterium]|nr:hypothetical protein [Patescibacteria group bacterium]